MIFKKCKNFFSDTIHNLRMKLYVRELKRKIDPKYFVDDQLLTGFESSAISLSFIVAPQKFKKQLHDEFGSTLLALPKTYLKMRLEQYKQKNQPNSFSIEGTLALKRPIVNQHDPVQVLVQPRQEHITIVPLLYPTKQTIINDHLLPLLRSYTKNRIQSERVSVDLNLDERVGNTFGHVGCEWVTERTLSAEQRLSNLSIGWMPKLVTGLEITRSNVVPNVTVQPRSEYIQDTKSLTDLYPNMCSRVTEEDLNLGRGCNAPFTLVDVPVNVLVDGINNLDGDSYNELERLRLEKFNDCN